MSSRSPSSTLTPRSCGLAYRLVKARQKDSRSRTRKLAVSNIVHSLVHITESTSRYDSFIPSLLHRVFCHSDQSVSFRWLEEEARWYPRGFDEVFQGEPRGAGRGGFGMYLAAI